MSDFHSFDPNVKASEAPLEAAPGAKTARRCGIAAIVCALTCVGIPLALILGIVAIVQANKAKAFARQYPETYALPSSSGLILGIVGLCLPVVMLPFVGIVSAIAIPAILGQRVKAEGNRINCLLEMTKLEQLLLQDYMEMLEHSDPVLKSGAEAVIAKLLEKEQSRNPTPKNPYDGSFPFERAPKPSKPGTIALWAEKGESLGQTLIRMRWTGKGLEGEKTSTHTLVVF